LPCYGQCPGGAGLGSEQEPKGNGRTFD